MLAARAVRDVMSLLTVADNSLAKRYEGIGFMPSYASPSSIPSTILLPFSNTMSSAAMSW